MKKKHLKVLRKIQEDVPKDISDNLTREVDSAPTVKKIIDIALKDPNISEEKKRQYQLVKDAGYLDMKELEVDPEMEKALDSYYEKEIDKAIKRGDLPKEDPAYLKKVKKIYDRRTKEEKERGIS